MSADNGGMSDLVYLPSRRSDSFVELARTKSGRVFRKQILHANEEFVNPNDPTKKIRVTDEMMTALARNFQDSICDIVQVPVCDDKNRHTEDPLRNLGEVIDVQVDKTGVFALIDARKPSYADELGKTLIGASAMMSMDYTDSKTGKKVGPTLLHVAVTNRPYITKLDGFEEVIAASAGSADNDGEMPVLLTSAEMLADPDFDEETPEENPEMPMTKDEMIAALKADGMTVLTAEEAAAQAPKTEVPTELSNTLGLSNTDGTTITLDDVAGAVVELSATVEAQKTEITAMREERDALLLSQAEAEVDVLINEGRVLPKQRDAMIKLSRENREMFDELVPESSIVSLSETGVTTHDAPPANSVALVTDYAARMNAATSKK